LIRAAAGPREPDQEGHIMRSGTSTVWGPSEVDGSGDGVRPQPPRAAESHASPPAPAAPRPETWLATLARHRAAWRRRTGVTRYVTVGAAAGVGWGDHGGEAAIAAVLPGPLLRQHADWCVVPDTVLARLADDPGHRAAATQGLSNRARGGLERWAQRVQNGARNRATTSRSSRPSRCAVSRERDLGAVACAFAEAGGFVLTGRRLAWLTRGCPGGLHLGLIAPRVHREDTVARSLHLTRKEAAAYLERLGRHAVRWRRRGWPGVDPSAVCTLTCNTAHLLPEQVARVVAAAVDPGRAAGGISLARGASKPSTPPPAG